MLLHLQYCHQLGLAIGVPPQAWLLDRLRRGWARIRSAGASCLRFGLRRCGSWRLHGSWQRRCSIHHAGRRERRHRFVVVLYQDGDSCGSTDRRDCFLRAASGRRSRAPGSPGRRAHRPAASAAARSWRGQPRAPSCCSRRRWSKAWRRCGPRSAVNWAGSSTPPPAAPAAPVRCRSAARCRSGRRFRPCLRSARCAAPRA